MATSGARMVAVGGCSGRFGTELIGRIFGEAGAEPNSAGTNVGESGEGEPMGEGGSRAGPRTGASTTAAKYEGSVG